MITLGEIQEYLPRYLSEADQRGLAEQLNDFQSRNYYTRQYEGDLLQGDGWTGLTILRFENGERRKVRGILLSNSCDIAHENRRDFPSRIIFAPLVALRAFVDLLRGAGVGERQIESKVAAMKEQRVTSIFYLPAGSGLDEESIAILDDLHTVPASSFRDQDEKLKLFTLSQMGFWLFLFKLSIHFCRFQEGLAR